MDVLQGTAPVVDGQLVGEGVPRVIGPSRRPLESVVGIALGEAVGLAVEVAAAVVTAALEAAA